MTTTAPQLLPYLERLLDGETVEWKTLGEVAEYVRQRVAVDQLCAQTYVGVDNLLPNRAGKQDSNYIPTEGNAIAYQPNDILIGNIRPYLKKIWKADNEGGASADVLVVRITNSLLTPGYLYHLLADDRFFSYDMQHAKGAKMPRGNKEKILDYVLPIPPLRVQSRIVEILDKFTQLEAQLEAELQAELKARRKQYAYYRDQILNFSQYPPLNVNIKWKTLGEVFNTRNGYTPSKANEDFWQDGTIPWFRMDDIRANGRILYNSALHITPQAVKRNGLFKANSILLATTATIGEHALLRQNALANQQLTNFEIKEEFRELLIPKFAFYYFFIINEWCKANARQNSLPSVDLQKLRKEPFPLPPLEEQRRIVDILDRFDTLTNSISEELPREIALRRKQYEYYRDALLRFPTPAPTA